MYNYTLLFPKEYIVPTGSISVKNSDTAGQQSPLILMF